MSDLEPCPGCRRHVRVDDASCPFCATALGATGEARVLSSPRLTRAAVFAGAALVSATAGCGGKGHGPETTVVDNEATGVIVDAAPTPDAVPVVNEQFDNSCCMPYGAPPRRERLV
jgi:hypothetical protein